MINNKVKDYKSYIVHSGNRNPGFLGKYLMPENDYAKYLHNRSRVKTRTWKNWARRGVNSIKLNDKDIPEILKRFKWDNHKLYKSITPEQMELIGLTLREKVILKKFENLDTLQYTRASNAQLEKIINAEVDAAETKLHLESGDELATFPTKHRVLPGYNLHDFNPKKNWKVRSGEPAPSQSNY